MIIIDKSGIIPDKYKCDVCSKAEVNLHALNWWAGNEHIVAEFIPLEKSFDLGLVFHICIDCLEELGYQGREEPLEEGSSREPQDDSDAGNISD